MKRFLPMLLIAALTGCNRPAPKAPAIPDSPISASLSTNRVYIGDPVEVRLSVAHEPEATVNWPRLGDEKKIVVRDQVFKPSTGSVSEARWTIASFEIGEHSVWSGAVAVVQADGSRSNLDLPSLSLTVESILPALGENLRDPKGLLKWPREPMTKLFIVLGLVALLAGLIALLVRWIIHRKNQPAPAPAPVPAHEKALLALAALEQQTDFATADPEPFFVAISTIVRHYLEDRFELRAPEQTTEEFIRAASSSSALRLEHQHLVGDFLTECDLVKFARHRPDADRMRKALAAGYRLVRETVPAPAAPGQGGAA